MSEHGSRQTRRRFLGWALSMPVAMAAPAAAAGEKRAPTPACGDAGITPRQTAGPYFKPQSPLRSSLLEAGVSGRPLIIEGRVLDLECRPVGRALLDFWQADASGEYDLGGYRLRGHQLADDGGRYRLETVVPGEYPGRTRHIHVRVQAPGQPVLTTQLYFPGEPGNLRDGIFDPALVMAVRRDDNRSVGRFDFVLAIRTSGT